MKVWYELHLEVEWIEVGKGKLRRRRRRDSRQQATARHSAGTSLAAGIKSLSPRFLYLFSGTRHAYEGVRGMSICAFIQDTCFDARGVHSGIVGTLDDKRLVAERSLRPDRSSGTEHA